MARTWSDPGALNQLCGRVVVRSGHCSPAPGAPTLVHSLCSVRRCTLYPRRPVVWNLARYHLTLQSTAPSYNVGEHSMVAWSAPRPRGDHDPGALSCEDRRHKDWWLGSLGMYLYIETSVETELLVSSAPGERGRVEGHRVRWEEPRG